MSTSTLASKITLAAWFTAMPLLVLNAPNAGATTSLGRMDSDADGAVVTIGRPEGSLPADLRTAFDDAQKQGGTPVVAQIDGTVAGVITVRDTVKPTSTEAITQFRALGLTPVLLTGDNAAVAARCIWRWSMCP